MKNLLLLLLALAIIGCKQEDKTNRACENLEKGYVWVDAANIVHWNENCKWVQKDMLLLIPLDKMPKNYCSCVSSKNKERIENKFIETKSKKNIAKPDSIAGGVTPKYLLNADGKEHAVSVENIEKYTMQKYASDYPGATIRMRDEQNEDYDVPLNRYDWAVSRGFRPFIIYD